MDEKTPLGPNVKALLSERWSQLMVDRAGHAGGEFGKVAAVAARIAEGNGAKLKSDMREAFEWTKAAIAAVRSAPDCKWTTDEEIAGEIVSRIYAKRGTR
jgi:hypothetical protein